MGLGCGEASSGAPSWAVTRTDAMASEVGIYVAGWSATSIEQLMQGNYQWYLFHLDVSFFPYVKASPNRVISAAQAVAEAMAVAAFGNILIERTFIKHATHILYIRHIPIRNILIKFTFFKHIIHSRYIRHIPIRNVFIKFTFIKHTFHICYIRYIPI